MSRYVVSLIYGSDAQNRRRFTMSRLTVCSSKFMEILWRARATTSKWKDF